MLVPDTILILKHITTIRKAGAHHNLFASFPITGNFQDFRSNDDTIPIKDAAEIKTIDIENSHLIPGTANARSEIAVHIQMTAP